MKISLAVQTPEFQTRSAISVLSGTFAEMAERAARWGADGLELMPVEPARLEVVELRSCLRANRLETAAVGTALLAILAGLTLLDPDNEKANQARQRLYQTIDFAAALNAPLLSIGGFRGRFSTIPGKGRELLAEILRRAGDYAQPLGVRIILEPINRYQSDGIATAAEGLRFLEEVDHPAVGLFIDTCHMTMEETSWTEPFRRVMAAGKLWHVHIAESNRLYPGHGLVDFPAILSTLAEIGYDQHLALEILARPDPDSAAREGLAYLRRLLGRN